MPVRSNEDKYQYFMALIDKDPMEAARQFLDDMERTPLKRKTERALLDRMDTMNNLKKILSGDQSGWAYGAKNEVDAVRYIITNSLMKAMGHGVLYVGPREDVANIVANIITEDVNFLPLTAEQRRMKLLAESYGFVVYPLEEEDD
jgi:hypothetical protein